MKGYQLGLYEKAMPTELSWREKLLCAGQAGFDYVEISIDETDERLARLDWSVQERMRMNRLFEETGVPVRSMCLSGHRKYPLGSHDGNIRTKSLEIMRGNFHATGLWTSEYEASISEVDRSASWIELRYDRDGRDVRLRIDLTGGESQ